MLFTDKELLNITTWLSQTTKPTKFECKWLLTFKNRILKSKKEVQLKQKCFCTEVDRISFKKEFNEYWNLYNGEQTAANPNKDI